MRIEDLMIGDWVEFHEPYRKEVFKVKIKYISDCIVSQHIEFHHPDYGISYLSMSKCFKPIWILQSLKNKRIMKTKIYLSGKITGEKNLKQQSNSQEKKQQKTAKNTEIC